MKRSRESKAGEGGAAAGVADPPTRARARTLEPYTRDAALQPIAGPIYYESSAHVADADYLKYFNSDRLELNCYVALLVDERMRANRDTAGVAPEARALARQYHKLFMSICKGFGPLTRFDSELYEYGKAWVEPCTEHAHTVPGAEEAAAQSLKKLFKWYKRRCDYALKMFEDALEGKTGMDKPDGPRPRYEKIFEAEPIFLRHAYAEMTARLSEYDSRRSEREARREENKRKWREEQDRKWNKRDEDEGDEQ